MRGFVYSFHIIRISRRMTWAGHVAHMMQKMDESGFCWESQKRPLGRLDVHGRMIR
jgi:hypothetical protein